MNSLVHTFRPLRAPLLLLAAFIVARLTPAQAQGGGNNPPQVHIVWPASGDSFSHTTLIKIKAEATDLDGTIESVQFFADTNFIAVVTNRPFNAMWWVDRHPEQTGTWRLKAVAVDNSGARTESAPVEIWYYTGAPPQPVLELTSPRDGLILAAPATFLLTAELLGSAGGEAGPVEFFVGTNSVGLATQSEPFFTVATPLYSTTVSNVAEGRYVLALKYHGSSGFICRCGSSTIRVTKLGVGSPTLTPDGRLQFEVVTSFPGKETVVEASPNLLEWVPISTNVPAGNTFLFKDPSPATNSMRFYRVVVPSG